MKFDSYARRQTETLFNAITNDVAKAAKTELDALKASVEARIAALDEAVKRAQRADQLNELIKNLGETARADVDAARAEAEGLGAKALLKAQEVADGELAGVRADAQAKIAAEQKVSAALRDAVEEARQQLRSLQTSFDAEQAAAKAAHAAAQVEFERMRGELEGRIEQVQAARAELARVLGDTQREAAAAQAESATHLSSLEDARARIRAVEHECTELLLARDEAAQRADAESKRIAELTESLAALRHEAAVARQDATLAKVDAEGRRQGLEAATERIRVLEEMVAHPTSAGVAATAAPSVDRDLADVQLLEHVGTALESIDVAISASEILETLIEQFGRHFARAAVFLVGPSSFRGWKGAGLGPGTDISNIEIPRTIDSLLTRALAERKATTAESNAGDPAVGVLGSPMATALALPVFANGRVIALAYAEHAQDASLAVGCKIAEILIDHANRRLTVKRRSGTSSSASDVDRLGGAALERAATNYSPARQEKRIAMPRGLEVVLEGSPSELIDLSVDGAQVLSPVAMRPKRVVRLVLKGRKGEVTCKGRVVWAQFEQAQGAEARYRAGLKFTETDTRAVASFLSEFGQDHPIAAKLEETA